MHEPHGRVFYRGGVIEAAGGVVWRVTSRQHLKVLLVHRPRYHDWSMPKGKLMEWVESVI